MINVNDFGKNNKQLLQALAHLQHQHHFQVLVEELTKLRNELLLHAGREDNEIALRHAQGGFQSIDLVLSAIEGARKRAEVSERRRLTPETGQAFT